MKAKKFTTLYGVALALSLGFSTTQAAVLTINLNTEFSGGTPPAGAAPWLTATFEDIALDTVRLTMSTSGLTGGEFVDGSGANFGWGFNIDPLLSASALNFTFVSGNDANLISTGVDSFKADGDGFFDILFSWDPAPSSRFAAGQTSVYNITGIAGLDALDFNFNSVNGVPGNGNWTSAAHVQNIGPNGESGWIGGLGRRPEQEIPEPGILLLLAAGLAGLGLSRRRSAV
ncbi:putative secreted protein with PEP-CTERM sorting signal [Nitrosomonas nitrosa]|uniref:PEP-CTERM sorting domain-containing protein n=1 Tax=Nitrosomonas nitrosa TaxID=52442 RepID=UPI000D319EE8|nr:PEP-CTERM sorting domain-containing protein [Nitrosomonas nitrosa]PTQ98830.1 putative secreted protein with PEP-CTERM sorting signal [Nitrosomonas nitrosa]